MASTPSIPEFSRIVLTEDVPRAGLRAGDFGTVVDVHRGGEGYTVEFFSLKGETVAVETLFASQVRPVGDHEIGSARRLAV